MVGVAGFEPAASWTRTMRDTKLRHTPIRSPIIEEKNESVKGKVAMNGKDPGVFPGARTFLKGAGHILFGKGVRPWSG